MNLIMPYRLQKISSEISVERNTSMLDMLEVYRQIYNECGVLQDNWIDCSQHTTTYYSNDNIKIKYEKWIENPNYDNELRAYYLSYIDLHNISGAEIKEVYLIGMDMSPYGTDFDGCDPWTYTIDESKAKDVLKRISYSKYEKRIVIVIDDVAFIDPTKKGYISLDVAKKDYQAVKEFRKAVEHLGCNTIEGQTVHDFSIFKNGYMIGHFPSLTDQDQKLVDYMGPKGNNTCQEITRKQFLKILKAMP